MSGLLKAITYARNQLRHLRKYGEDDEKAGAADLDQWLQDLAARNTPAAQAPAAVGFSRRDPAATAKQPQAELPLHQ